MILEFDIDNNMSKVNTIYFILNIIGKLLFYYYYDKISALLKDIDEKDINSIYDDHWNFVCRLS